MSVPHKLVQKERNLLYLALIYLLFWDPLSISALLPASPVFTIDDSVLAPSLSTHTLPPSPNTPAVPAAMWAIHAMAMQASERRGREGHSIGGGRVPSTRLSKCN